MQPVHCSCALRIAELQANRLLELFDVRGPFVPNELITDLPRVEVRYEDGLPVSGSAHWEAGQWIITLNASEPYGRRRYSLMHEFKHCLDHTTKQRLYGKPEIDERAVERAERAADVFAAALLMPKRWIKYRWYESGQNLAILAISAGVSTRALSVRLYHLGIGQDRERCPRTSSTPAIRRQTYFRHRPLLAGIAP